MDPVEGKQSYVPLDKRGYNQREWHAGVTALAQSLKMNWQRAQMLHWKYAIEAGGSGSQEFKDAVYAIEFIKMQKGVNDSNKAYNMLVKAEWSPINA